MNWCGTISGEWHIFKGGVPDSCICYTFIFVIPAIIYVSSCFHRWHITSQYLPYGQLDYKTTLFLVITQISILIIIALQFGYYLLDAPEMGSMLLFTIIQSFGLGITAMITSREAWRISDWPGYPTRIYLLSVCVINLLAVISTRQSSSTDVLIVSSVLIVLSLLLLLFVQCKDMLRTPEERDRLELDRVSIDIYDGHPMFTLSSSQGSNYDPFGRQQAGRYGYWNASGFFQLLPQSDKGDTGDRRGEGMGFISWLWSWLVSDRSQEDALQQRLRSPLMNENDCETPSGRHSTSRGTAGANPPSRNASINSAVTGSSDAESSWIAVPPSSDPYKRAVSSDSAFSSLSSMRSFLPRMNSLGGGNNNGSTYLDDVPLVRSALESHLTVSSVNSSLDQAPAFSTAFTAQDATSGEMGLALQRALETQRARMGASSDSLSTSPHKSRSRQESCDSGRGRNASEDHISRGTPEGERLYSVTVERWGLRRDRIRAESRYDSVDGSASLSLSESLAKSAQSMQAPLAPATVENKVSEETEDSVAVEVEFELHVRVGKPRGADWSGGRSVGGRDHWLVWRTGAEVLQLHSSLASAFGDLAPRKPRLRSAQLTTTSASGSAGGAQSSLPAGCTPADIAADVRSVGVYLMALLRGKVYLDFPAVLSFLEVWDYDSSASAVAQLTDFSVRDDLLLGAAGGLTPAAMQDKWRKLFVSLRVRVKPHEIGVRCRLFEGVVSGSAIVEWLNSSGYSHSDACTIGQRLVTAGLLVTVCSGYSGSGPTDGGDDVSSLSPDAMPDTEESGARTGASGDGSLGSMSASSLTSMQWQDLLSASEGRPGNGSSKKVFSDLPGFLFTFQQKSSTSFAVGKFVLFGTTITAEIPQWVRIEPNTAASASSSSSSSSSSSGPDATETAPQSASTSGHVEYVVVCSHGGDQWRIHRRYREFAELHRLLLLKGVRPVTALPPKTRYTLGTMRSAAASEELDIRRVCLETYLTSVLEAVVQAQLSEPQSVLARFLDSQFDELSIH